MDWWNGSGGKGVCDQTWQLKSQLWSPSGEKELTVKLSPSVRIGTPPPLPRK